MDNEYDLWLDMGAPKHHERNQIKKLNWMHCTQANTRATGQSQTKIQPAAGKQVAQAHCKHVPLNETHSGNETLIIHRRTTAIMYDILRHENQTGNIVQPQTGMGPFQEIFAGSIKLTIESINCCVAPGFSIITSSFGCLASPLERHWFILSSSLFRFALLSFNPSQN